MKCPNPLCEGTLTWNNDFDIEDDEILDVAGNPYIVLSCYHCPTCQTMLSIPQK